LAAVPDAATNPGRVATERDISHRRPLLALLDCVRRLPAPGKGRDAPTADARGGRGVDRLPRRCIAGSRNARRRAADLPLSTPPNAAVGLTGPTWCCRGTMLRAALDARRRRRKDPCGYLRLG